MKTAIEEAFRWLFRYKVLSCEKFQLFFMDDEPNVNPVIIIVDENLQIVAHASAETYTSAFIEAVRQARENLSLS
jgi:hypothetical protein